MPGSNIKIPSSQGGAFDGYLAHLPGAGVAPAIVLACTIHGVDQDICDLADEFASHGLIAVAPDLFWRSVPGPLDHNDERAADRSQPRLEKIQTGEADLTDTLAHLRTLPQFNGRAAVIGFCYGGPYAILAPKRLGYAAGISCHGSQMLRYIGDLDDVTAPICIIWGDQDHQAPPEVLEAYRRLPTRMKNIELHIFPGIQHSYMMPGNRTAFDQATRAFSMTRTLAILESLRAAPLRELS